MTDLQPKNALLAIVNQHLRMFDKVLRIDEKNKCNLELALQKVKVNGTEVIYFGPALLEASLECLIDCNIDTNRYHVIQNGTTILIIDKTAKLDRRSTDK